MPMMKRGARPHLVDKGLYVIVELAVAYGKLEQDGGYPAPDRDVFPISLKSVIVHFVCGAGVTARRCQASFRRTGE